MARHPARTALGAGAALLTVGFFACLPVARFTKPTSAVVYARDGVLLAASTAKDQQWRFGSRASVPPRFAAALLCYEDRRFFWHPGIDLPAVVRAVRSNWRARHVVSGASTLTMQVVRLWRGSEPRTYREKLIETLLALRLEAAASKNEILAMYASNAPFGGNIVGLDAAAWRYFGVDPEHLSWSEAATLAVLPNSPSLVHPGRHRQLLLARRNRLLEVLRDAGEIDAPTCGSSELEPLADQPVAVPQLAPHLRDRLAAHGGAVVHTTLDAQMQDRVGAVVARHHQRLVGNHVRHAAAIVLDVDSGEVLAYVGNVLDDATDDLGGHVDVITAPRSTGSVLKPLLYAAAIDAGELLPYELLEDTPLRAGGFAPENFSHSYAGAVPAALAIARSLNVPAARLLQDFGVDRFHALLTRLGMTTLNQPASHYGLALILGGAEGTLWDITGIYASLARLAKHAGHGESVQGTLFAPHLTLTGAPGARTDPPLGAGAVYVMLQAMMEVERPGVEASWRDFAAPRQVAWKTGTSFGFRDGWAVGVTTRFAVGVWVGNADGEGRPGLTGISAAAPILFDIFDSLPKSPWFEAPRADLVPLTLCRHSGQRAGPHCTDTEIVMVPRAGLNGHVCAYCQAVHLDAGGRFRVHGNCEPVYQMRTVDRFVLPPVMEWFYRMRHANYAPLPPWRPDCQSGRGSNTASMSLIYPRRDSVIYVPIELDGRRGRAVFEATHRDARASIYWHLDDAYVGVTRDIHQMAVAPAPGRHRLTLVDQNGEHLEQSFTVLDKPRQKAP